MKTIKQEITVIIGALDAEIDEYLRSLEKHQKRTWKEFVFHEGQLAGKDVIIVKSGIGKVFAAMTTQKIIDTYNPKNIIFTGVAGGINQNYEIGDVIVAEDLVQHDFDVSELGSPRGAIPNTDYRFFKTDEKLRNLALLSKIQQTVHKGRILTGDQFLTKKELNEYDYLTGELKGDAVEMEGAAVAQVCVVNGVAFLVIRTISDKANDDASVDFVKFLPEIAKNSFQMVNHILINL